MTPIATGPTSPSLPTSTHRPAPYDGPSRDQVLAMRREFQDAMHRDLVAGVEELTGREVIAFFSANHIEPDTALESFLLAPRDELHGSFDGGDRIP